MTERRCDCGGEMQLEYFDPMKRPVEWFLRCRSCGYASPSEATQDAAVDTWNQSETA